MSVDVVMVGAGGFGLTWIPALAHHGCRVVAVIDPIDDAVDTLTNGLGIPGVRSAAQLSSETLLECRPDLVIDSSPPWFHVEHARMVLEHGSHYLCSKPMAQTADEANRMVELAEGSRGALAVAHQMRYFTCFQELRSRVARGDVGELRTVHVEMALNGLGWEPGMEWRLKMADPTLREAAIHHFDLMRYCLGREGSVLRASSWNPDGSPFAGEANVEATLDFEGVPVSYSAQFWPENDFVRFDSGWRVVGTEGVLEVRDGGVFHDGVQVLGCQEEPEPLELLNERLLADFFSSLASGREPGFNGLDNLGSLNVMFGAIKATGKSLARS